MRGRFSSSTYMKSFFDYSVVFCSSRLPALRRRTSRSPLQNLILSRRRWHLLGLKIPSNSVLTNSRD
ncbi:hypothetical protein Taro_056879 [Colocasia esculenta]|uniref:Uncharacterized protein n=1 Tax=Colocasia esculenta TaxID=4460 RepID=A0A843XV38_COLES|nr:hypothetical protein [Colocasia esculenta]